MKKLNITKEQFEKSKYFKGKYGTLEYVSESGRLFKTNKGKVLKFNESTGYSSDYREPNPKPKGWDPEVHGVAEKIMLKEIVKQLKAKRFRAVARDNARYMEIPFTWPTMLFNNPKVEERVNEIKDRFPGQLSFYGISTLHGGYGAMTFQMNKQYVFDQVESGNFHKFKESTKKSDKKFNESDELASILANLIRQASPESQERIMRMLERDADGTDAGKSAGERVRDSYRDDL